MIKVDGREYHNLYFKYPRELPTTSPPLLVTWTVDGEPSAPLYADSIQDYQDVLRYLADREDGVVENIRVWSLLKS